MARLVVTEGPGAGDSYELERALILGRVKSVDIRVQDPAASREHCKVFQQAGDYWVVDLNSRNGTRVNGNPVSRHRLNHGDLIHIGETAIKFVAPELAATAPPPAATRPAAAPARPSTPAVTPRGPSAMDRERERLADDAAAKARKAGGTGAAAADDGSGIVVREKVLQYGRIEDKGGLLRDDIGQTGGLVKIIVTLLAVAFFVGLTWGVVKLMAKPADDLDVPAETAPDGE